jgi:hypothetical protein
LSKALFTIAALLRNIRREHGTISLDLFFAAINSISTEQSGEARWRSYVTYAVPSILYLISNLLYLIALRSTTPALLHVAILAKVNELLPISTSSTYSDAYFALAPSDRGGASLFYPSPAERSSMDLATGPMRWSRDNQCATRTHFSDAGKREPGGE